jgi:di/tricarboxylate transporter
MLHHALQVRMMIPLMFLSAFLNNTPVVALFTPILISWARRSGISPKKLLIPLSYAAVLGGTCTLIGTSTNLVISGAQQTRYKNNPDAAKFGIFDIAPYGIPYALWGFLFIILTQVGGGWMDGWVGLFLVVSAIPVSGTLLRPPVPQPQPQLLHCFS